MSPFQTTAVLLVLAAVFAYLNHRLLKLPTTVGLMALSLLACLVVLVVGQVIPGVERWAIAFVGRIDLSRALLSSMLGFLLFAGALHIDLAELASRKITVALLATVSVLLSTLLVGGLTWCLLSLVGMPARLTWCLLFGSLISPTDPIAVFALLRHIGAPRPLAVTIAGESLFNDGVGVVVFLGLLEAITEQNGFGPAPLIGVFLWEVGGGTAFGLTASWLVYQMLRSVDSYQVEILLSIALVAGGYALADALHLSGPIAMVVAGLLIGGRGRRLAMSPRTVEHLDSFWELVDEVLNAVLFVLLGLEVLAIGFTARTLVVGLVAIPIVLLSRLTSVALPVSLLRRWRQVDRCAIRVLSWGGLRGAISVALALSLPAEVGGAQAPEREVILVMTYVVVTFSVLVQGLTIGPLTRRWLSRTEPTADKDYRRTEPPPK